MRTIKFRVWDKELKKYRSEKDGDYSLGVLSGKVRGIYGEEFPEMEVEQFTGFKDNKGNEIYEGDIIQSLIEPMKGNSIIKVVGEVYFDEKLGGYMFGNKHSTDKESDTVEFGVCMAISDSVEIIGNVYENPDLVLGVSEADT